MKKNIVILFIHCLVHIQISYSQSNNNTSNSGFKEYYPIHIKPSIGYTSNMNEFEDILFEARPTVNYSIFNNMRYRMQNYIYKPSDAIYLSFQPHLRMYTENSFPVKMPSYKIVLGWQRLVKTDGNNFFAWALESGHYSNGQSGCPFGEGSEAESEECNRILSTINDQSNLSALLNRRNANFSTNTTKLTLNFRLNNLNKDNRPYKVHSFLATWELFHNNLLGIFKIGGYTDFDIKIYGRNRFSIGYEFIHTYKSKFRYSVKQEVEIIDKTHSHVEPLRSETSFTLYPFTGARDLGLFAKYIYGHDNYNYRLVDSGNQFSIGFNWDWFAPFEIKRAQRIQSQKKL